MDWDTRLAVSYDDGAGEKLISPIDSFSPTFQLQAEPLHSIEQTHIGVVYQPVNITFAMTVKAMGTAAAELTTLALSGSTFKIVMMEQTGDDWAFSKVVLDDCIITNAVPTTASTSGAPTATFSGFSLAASATNKSAAATAIP
jgi:hypothetical protein